MTMPRNRLLSTVTRWTSSSTAWIVILLSLTLCSFTAQHTHAQAPVDHLGIGGQIGSPSGLSAKYYPDEALAYEGILSYDVSDRYVLFNTRLLHERSIPASPLNYFFGPGLTFVADAGSAAAGVSATLGINFFRERFEVLLHVTPRLALLPGTAGALGYGIGLHYFLP